MDNNKLLLLRKHNTQTFQCIFPSHFVFVLQHLQSHVEFGLIVQFKHFHTLKVLKPDMKILLNDTTKAL